MKLVWDKKKKSDRPLEIKLRCMSRVHSTRFKNWPKNQLSEIAEEIFTEDLRTKKNWRPRMELLWTTANLQRQIKGLNQGSTNYSIHYLRTTE